MKLTRYSSLKSFGSVLNRSDQAKSSSRSNSQVIDLQNKTLTRQKMESKYSSLLQKGCETPTKQNYSLNFTETKQLSRQMSGYKSSEKPKALTLTPSQIKKIFSTPNTPSISTPHTTKQTKMGQGVRENQLARGSPIKEKHIVNLEKVLTLEENL